MDEFVPVRSEVKEQEIAEQVSAIENNTNFVHTNSLNKLHSSQSYHQSNSKNSEFELLHRKIENYKEALR